MEQVFLVQRSARFEPVKGEGNVGPGHFTGNPLTANQQNINIEKEGREEARVEVVWRGELCTKGQW